jgi:hypothetical protein
MKFLLLQSYSFRRPDMMGVVERVVVLQVLHAVLFLNVRFSFPYRVRQVPFIPTASALSRQHTNHLLLLS